MFCIKTYVPLSKVSVSGDNFKTVAIDKSAFSSGAYTVDISEVKDINNVSLSGTGTHTVSSADISKLSTSIDGIFLGGKSFKVSTKIKNFTSQSKGINVIGAMGKNFESASDEVWNTLLSWQNDGIEIWHHGYASTADEYNVSGGGGNTTQETMLENFSKTYDLFDNPA